MRCLITGATGMVGSHLAEACVRRGDSVVTIARAQSDTGLLDRLGVQIVRGDMSDPQAVAKAAQGVDAVVHCAAKVGDWGPVEDYRQVNVEGLRSLLDAVRGKPLKRFVHLSSLGVYEARHHYRTDETTSPPDQHMDGYTQTKVESEKLALQYHRDHGVPVVVLRPGFIYGPRDRTVLPNLIENLRAGKVRYIGNGEHAMNNIYVGNLVDAILLALDNPKAVGQIYNLTDDEPVSKRRFIEAVANNAGLTPPDRSVPLWLAKIVASGMEGIARLKGARKAPRLTKGRIKFMGLNLDFSVEKAKRDLGYRPRVKFDEGIKEAVAWWKQQDKPKAQPQPSAAGA